MLYVYIIYVYVICIFYICLCSMHILLLYVKKVKESFWKEVVYPEALKIWRTQTVMNVSDCVNDRAWNEHVRNSLKFQVLDKTNPNDTWGGFG